MLGKDKLKTMEVLISKSLINSYTSHDEFDLVNNVLREYNEIIEEIKKLCVLYYIKAMETDYVSCKKILRTKIQMSEKLNKID